MQIKWIQTTSNQWNEIEKKRKETNSTYSHLKVCPICSLPNVECESILCEVEIWDSDLARRVLDAVHRKFQLWTAHGYRDFVPLVGYEWVWDGFHENSALVCVVQAELLIFCTRKDLEVSVK